MDFEKLYINSVNLIKDLTPHFKRQDIFISFLMIIAEELQVSMDSLYSMAVKNRELLKYDGRIGVYEEFLNDYWDNTLRRIYISTNDVSGGFKTLYLQDEYDPTPDTLYLQQENKSDWTLYLQSEIAGLTFFNYTIYVPAALYASWTTDQKAQFEANAAIYALTGYKFEIQTF
jgi:hypothetical protein